MANKLFVWTNHAFISLAQQSSAPLHLSSAASFTLPLPLSFAPSQITMCMYRRLPPESHPTLLSPLLTDCCGLAMREDSPRTFATVSRYPHVVGYFLLPSPAFCKCPSCLSALPPSLPSVFEVSFTCADRTHRRWWWPRVAAVWSTWKLYGGLMG